METLTSRHDVSDHERFVIDFPQRNQDVVRQDVEVCDVTFNGEKQRIRFHDYVKIFEIPGLYEHLFYNVLECCSPQVVVQLLAKQVTEFGLHLSMLRVFDVGAGNGMVGEELRAVGVETVVGADILPAAGAATLRDRPKVYDEYLVTDLTKMDASQSALLKDQDFNCLVTVAALGFGDMPPEVFRVAYDLVCDGGFVALTINEEFMNDGDGSGFSNMIGAAVANGALKVLKRLRYRHRLSVTGEPIFYVAIVMQKLRDI